MTDVLPVFLPLIGFLISFLFGKQIGDRGAQIVTCTGLIAAAALSVMLFFDVALGGHPRTHELMSWISSGAFDVSWSVRLDSLSVVMMCVITIVSSCVHVYSVGYMSHDDAQARFMSYLSLFTFAMMMLVTADNLVQLFFGWEGVGLASYLLIGFWNHKHSANAAAMKAFIVNRVGDLGLALGVFGCLVMFDSLQFDQIFMQAPSQTETVFRFLGHEFHALTLICLLLFIGAVGKSAQLGLHTWLPDAMEGPTPVSALIHAATMVTAGVFLVCRFSPLFELAPYAKEIVTVVGALTAIFAATIGMTQFDIKRVIAYSTMSQLGYMFFAAGVGGYGAAMFHLMTHAFFKALLFLGAGSVIHAMSDEQDMRKMGGIWKEIPITYAMMWIGSLALAGIPFFAGYYSKDMILETAFGAHSGVGMFAFWIGIAAAFMTAFYSWRLIIMTFHGKPRADHHTMEHVHESPFIMLLPLFVLAAGALFAGYLFYPYFVGEKVEAFWGASIASHEALHEAHHVPSWVPLAPLVVALTGIALGYLCYLWATNIPGVVARLFKPIHQLFFRKWYVDELYDALFVKPAWVLGRGFFQGGDQAIINGLGPDGLASLSRGGAGVLSRIQSGYVYHYALTMIVAIVALMGWLLLKLKGVI
ncbi:MAG: NADH-quinone oxidoreductase subunit L [Alphaproteobacteria bacterium]|nr:NADH-quinone oxidoreductase subunit L [Alphaproteobacteria bacterium]